ncbi:response regulator transcription factor [Pseudoalteromonas spongiae]|uniref:response regulator transcription factor n=1 Tax=Pseudoalteromonas spongiae TaxID=298657 RepID=UPI00110BA318|nr:LuxR C-terminal-related transcriptional regulator [Pseudoalteromonas spongiae]TMO86409.1 hypothetical protein CWC15_06190 [Pseudoalteromonas spongiae]
MDFYIIGKEHDLASKVFKCACLIDAKVRFVMPGDSIKINNTINDVCFIEFDCLSDEVSRRFEKSSIVVLSNPFSLEQECAYLHDGYRGVIDTTRPPQQIIDQLQLLLNNIELLYSRAALSKIALQYLQTRVLEFKPISALTRKENQIVTYIQSGLQNKEIAKELAISPATVKTHVQRILKKTGAKNRTQIISKTAAY